MQGFRTILAALIGGPLVVWMARHGFDLTPDMQNYLIGGVMTLLMVGMRFVTKTPVGGSDMSSSGTGRQRGSSPLGVMVLVLWAVLVGSALFSACAATGGAAMTPTAKAELQAVTRIAVRRAFSTSPRATEKAQNVRAIVATLHAVTSSQSTVAGLTAVVQAELDKLSLTPLDRADANDLLRLLSVALEARFQGADAERLVQLNEFLQFVLDALPPSA